eukprot:m.65363 g.65363  ORF g.65363 m.65363 type:complete len:499 (-) comp11729_c1_seq1:121-1617(-)
MEPIDVGDKHMQARMHEEEDGSDTDYDDAIAFIPEDQATNRNNTRSESQPAGKKQKTNNGSVQVVRSETTQTTTTVQDEGDTSKHIKRRVIVLKSALRDASINDKYFPTVSRCLNFLHVGKSKYYDCVRNGIACNGWFISHSDGFGLDAAYDDELFTKPRTAAGWNLKPGSRPRPTTLTCGNQIKKCSSISSACAFLNVGKPTFYKHFRAGHDIKGWKIECGSLSETDFEREKSPPSTPEVTHLASKTTRETMPWNIKPNVSSYNHTPHTVYYPPPAVRPLPPYQQPQHLHWSPNPTTTFCNIPGCYQEFASNHLLKEHLQYRHSNDELLEQYMVNKNLLTKVQKDFAAAVRKSSMNPPQYGSNDNGEWSNSAFNQWDFTYPNFGETMTESPEFKLGIDGHLFKLCFGSSRIEDKFRILQVSQLDTPAVALHVDVKVCKLVSIDRQTTQRQTLIQVSEVQKAVGRATQHQVSSAVVDNFGESVVLLRVEARISLILNT